MPTRSTTWRTLCVQADPDHTKNSRLVEEYEFGSTGRSKTGNERTHDGGRRIFVGDYQTRGPYAPEEVAEGGLTWNGRPLTWNDEDLTWTP